MYDLITIGAATFDIFFSVHNASQFCSIDQTLKRLCIQAGEKIPVEDVAYSVGGNAANIAVGASRLGLSVATYLHYGNDEFAIRILNTLEKEGVHTEYVVQDRDKPTGLGLAINFQGERTLFVHHIKRNHSLPSLPKPKWLYLTSVGDHWEHLYKQTVAFVKETNPLFAFSPGSHQFERGVEEFREHISLSEIVFVNKEEARRICEGYVTHPKAMLEHIKGLGAKMVSITDGEHGAYAIDQTGKTWFSVPFPTTCIERTGAGDAYATGFLAAYANGKNIPEAMLWGSINASSVIRSIGAQLGLLRKEELEKIVAVNKSLLAKPI